MMLCSSKTREGRSEVECSHRRNKTAKPKELGRDFGGEDARGMHCQVAMMLHGRLFVATPTELHAAYVQFFVYSLYLGKIGRKRKRRRRNYTIDKNASSFVVQ